MDTDIYKQSKISLINLKIKKIVIILTIFISLKAVKIKYFT